MKNTKNLLILPALLLSLSACIEQDQNGLSEDVQDLESYATELAVESISKSTTDFSSEVSNVQISSQDVTGLDDLNAIDPQEPAPDRPGYFFCKGPAYRQACVTDGDTSTKTAVFDGCLLPYTRLQATGEIQLQYNNDSCSMSETGNQVERTYRYSLQRRHGGSANFTSEENSNYLGDSFGGGELLTKTESGFELEILGRHVEAEGRLQKVKADVSVKTDVPIVIEGTLRRSSRLVVSGTTSVHHNIAEFTATYTAKNLQWNDSCACPISGSLDVKFTGSIEREGAIEFNGCNSQELDEPKKRRRLPIRLRNCLNLD